MQAYLASSTYLDFDHPAVAAQAAALAQEAAHADGNAKLALAQRCFEFVRDEIRHSGDHKLNPVTIKASDVLTHRTGYCYAKSHLLAALLRANGIPTGLCYQRLSVADGGGAPYCLHGLNAVHLPEFGWYRIDARGNKPGVDAQFTPPHEKLAFALQDEQERDLPEIWAEPLPVVIEALQAHGDVLSVGRKLPDVPLMP